MKPSQLITTIICLSLILISAGCTDSSSNSQDSQPAEQPTSLPATEESSTTQNSVTPSGQNLTVHFLDVGQGDSVLLEFNGKSMLIDAGEQDKGEVVTDYLQEKGILTLDCVVATHPHSDHIGGMDGVLKNYKVGYFVDSGDPHTSKTYEMMLITVALKNIYFERVKTGKAIDFDPAVDIEVLNPTSTYSDDLNENSVVLKVTYGKTSFLLMGDSGLETEERIMKAGCDVNSDILKVGYHASRSGSVEDFISAVSPEVSVIEVGARNDYGYPHPEILDRLQKASKVYRTDLDGTITITTDGSTYSVTTQKAGAVSSGSAASSSTPVPDKSITPSSTESTV